MGAVLEKPASLLTRDQSVLLSDCQFDNALDEDENHCHGADKETKIDTTARRQLLIASMLCLFFMVAEAIGGYMASSLAIMTDAAHLLTDFASFMISLLAMHLSVRPATKSMSFGWHRAEIMGALISVFMIWVVTAVLVVLAIQRVQSGDYDIHAKTMLIISSIGVAVNLVMGIVLHQGGHTHSHGLSGGHGHSHGGDDHGHAHGEYGAIDGQGGEEKMNINVRAAFIHVLGDLLQSVGVLGSALIIFFRPDWKVADPICTFIFSGLVLFTTANIIKDAFHILMEGTPASVDYNKIKASFLNLEGVRSVHNMRVWSLTLNRAALSTHIAAEAGTDTHQLLRQCNDMLRQDFEITETAIQIELYDAGRQRPR